LQLVDAADVVERLYHVAAAFGGELLGESGDLVEQLFSFAAHVAELRLGGERSVHPGVAVVEPRHVSSPGPRA
jgi:hypothetical protein